MENPGRPVLTLTLCLLLRNVYSQDDAYTVDGAANHGATLPCSITRPSNWKDHQFHIIWFKNFTDKLWDCAVKDKKAPDCRSSPKSSRTKISWKFFGNADLEISALQESDAGSYQCWILLSDAYRRRDVRLRVHGVHSEGPVKDTSGQWSGLVTVSSWSILLLSGWPVAIFLAAVLLSHRLCINRSERKRGLPQMI